MTEKTLLLYSSTDGHTIKIMRHIESVLTGECERIDLHTAEDIDWSRYQRVIIGASIRYGHFNKALYRFIRQFQVPLQVVRASFFCVNLTARKPNRNTAETSLYIRSFLKKSPWHPEHIGVFAGALDYPNYGWFDRTMIQFIMKMTGGETDKSKSIEYTDWEKVTEFALSCIENR